MRIEQRTNEELKEQIKNFLNSLTESEKISQKTSNKILNALDINEGVLTKIKKKLHLETDIYDKRDVEKNIKKSLSKKWITFEEIRDEYIKRQKNETIDTYKTRRAKKVFETYATKNASINNRIISVIKNNLWSIENMRKIKSFLNWWSHESLEYDNGRKLWFLEKEMEERKVEDLEFFLTFENIDLNVLEHMHYVMKSNPEIFKILKIFREKYDIRNFADIKKLQRHEDEIYRDFMNHEKYSYETIIKNIELLDKEGYNTQDKEIIPLIINKNLEKGVALLKGVRTSDKKKTEMLKSLKDCLDDHHYKKIQTLLNIVPGVYHEAYEYTSKKIQIEGNENTTKERIQEVFGQIEEHTGETLRIIRTDKRTKNWSKNVNFAKDLWIIKSGKIFSKEELYKWDRDERISQNAIIAHLKTISHEDLLSALEKLKEIGIKQQQMKRWIEIILYHWVVSNNTRKIKILIDDIWIKDVQTILNIRDGYDTSKISKIFDGNIDPDIVEKNIELVRSMGITTTEEILEVLNTICETNPENLEIIIKNTNIRIPTEINQLNLVLCNSKPKNLKVIIEKITKNIEDLNELIEILCNSKPENLEIIIEKWDIRDVQDLIDLKTILIYKETEIIKKMVDVAIKFRIDLTIFWKILFQVNPENLEIIINNTIINFNTDQKEKTIKELDQLKDILSTAKPENLETIINNSTKNIDDLVKFHSILQEYHPDYLKILIKIFTWTKNNLTPEKQTEYLQNMRKICQRSKEYAEEFVKSIQENKKWFDYGYFVEATKNGIETKNHNINKENFLDYMDENTQLFSFEQDSSFILDGTTPRTKSRFLENIKRTEYLKPETIETFRKFWTIIWLGILEGAESAEKLKKFYEYIFTNISPEKSRNSILQLWEVFSVLLKQWKYEILDEIADNEVDIWKEFKHFIEKHKISDKWKTILTLMITREINSSFSIRKNKETTRIESVDIKKILLSVFEKFEKYKKIIDKYDKLPIKTSIGVEYEITKSIAEWYKNITQGDYKKDIETLSAYSGISRWNDAIHEIATKPSDNPYLMLLELKLLEDLDFMDLNFKNEDYKKGWRTVHITLWWEYGVSFDKNANFIQNILNVSNLGWINLGEDVKRINRFSNIREKWTDCEAIFSNGKTECTEYRSLDINKAEQFERLLISIFNLNTAKQILDKYVKKEFIDQRTKNRFNLNKDEFKRYAEEHNIWKEPIEDEKIYTLIYEFLDLQNDILDIIDDHNKNFLANETISTTNSMAFDELIHLIQNKGDVMLYMKMMNVDIKYLSSLINKNIESEKDFFEQLKNDWKDIDNISEDKERNTMEGKKMKLTNAKKIVYFSYKKNFKPTLEKLQKEDPKIFKNISKYFENQDIEEIERKRRNRTRLDDEFRKTKKTPEKYLKSIQINKNDFFEIITPELVNKFTHMNNFFLKQDSTNASSMFDATKENNWTTITDHKSAETNIFDKIDQKIAPRNWYYYIQWASEKMITQAIQKRILEFNENVFENILEEKTLHDEKIKLAA